MKYKIIGIDLDGTLLTKTKKITKDDLEAIKKYINNGGIPTIVTGRSPVSAIKFLQKIESYSKTKLRFLCAFNGAYILDQLENKEYKNFISNDICKELYNYGVQKKISMWFYTENSRLNGSVEAYGTKFRLSSKLFKNLNLQNINPRKDISSYKLNLFCSSKKKMNEIFDELSKKYKGVLNFSLSNGRLIEVNNASVDKGYAIKFVTEKSQLNKEDVLFLGDSNNDVPGFKESGFSIAIKPSNKKVIQFASTTIDHKKNAVSEAIHKYILSDESGYDVRLVAIDLDGTLLETKTKLPVSYTAKRIRQIVDDRGLNFAVATGRNVDDIMTVIKDLGIRNLNNCYCVANNGSLIYEYRTNNYIYQKPIPGDIARTIFTEIKTLNESGKFGPIACYAHRVLDLEKIKNNEVTKLLGYNLEFVKARLSRASKNFLKNSWHPKEFCEIQNFNDIKIVCKFVVFANCPANNAKVYDYFTSLGFDVNVSTSGPTNVEIYSSQASKGNAVSFLAQKLGININQAMTFGDEENDISMLSITSNSYTLSSSKEKVQKAASNVLKSKASYFVGEAIDKVILKK